MGSAGSLGDLRGGSSALCGSGAAEEARAPPEMRGAIRAGTRRLSVSL
ncbi:hypothetical protein ACMA5I_05205 [Paracoccaceae bacterium GXU_MW_L88]